MWLNIPEKCFRETVDFLNKYLSSDRTHSPKEYIDVQRNVENTCDKVVWLFLSVMKREEFLTALVYEYYPDANIDCKVDAKYLLIFNLLIYEMNESNFEMIYAVSTDNFVLAKIHRISKIFVSEELMLYFVRIASKFYDNEYILEIIIKPILSKQELYGQYYTKLNEQLKNKIKRKIIPTTTPVAPKCLMRSISKLKMEKSEDIKFEHIKPTKIPITTYKLDCKIRSAIRKAFQENSEAAKQLFVEAQEKAFKCARAKPRRIVNDTKPIPNFKAKKCPDWIYKKPFEIKPTAATTLREAAFVIRKKEQEISRLEQLCEGAFDETSIELIENELRRQKQEEDVRDIERKHLQGLLTREEAVLAKHNLVLANKDKMAEFKKERDKLKCELEEWKEEELEKIRDKVLKAQMIERNAREAVMNLYERKYESAREVDEETRELLRMAAEEKQIELMNKIKLIEEIRAVQAVRSAHVSQFDPDECMGLGFMGEMSLTDLREKLALLRESLEEELKKRREHVRERRTQRSQLLDEAKKIVEENKADKMEQSNTTLDDIVRPYNDKIRSRSDKKIHEVEQLKRKLQEKREMRIKLCEELK